MKIYLVGMGPGREEMLTGQAMKVLQGSDIIVGYTVYVDLVRKFLPDKEFRSTPMRGEIERCRLCYELAAQGKTVSLVCSGDAGVYGLAAPMYELLPQYPGTELEVVPGITAATSGAALLGCPLNHDFCVISLSDLLTPWESIERRLRAAVTGDFAIAIYNPSSHKRRDYLKKACDILLDAGAEPTRACGIARNIGRDGEGIQTMTLSELRLAGTDMFSTVFVGNSQTRIFDGKLITKRGYRF